MRRPFSSRSRSDPRASPPAHDADFPDPQVVRDGDRWVAYGTNAAGSNVQVLTSPDLRTWTPAPDALPELPAWSNPGLTWSPAVLPVGGRHVLWYVVRHRASERQVLSVATGGAGAAGPFADRSEAPAVAQIDLGGSIDPSPFVDDDGTAYLFWKDDANAIGRRASLWAQPLTADGDALTDRPTRLLGHDRAWERPLIEAPSVAHAGGRYWLFYSGGWWESDTYGIGYATAEHPLGPWTKQTVTRPWLASSDVAVGPGGQEVFPGPDGPCLAYHAWSPGRVGYTRGGARTLRIGALDLSGDVPGLAPLPS